RSTGSARPAGADPSLAIAGIEVEQVQRVEPVADLEVDERLARLQEADQLVYESPSDDTARVRADRLRRGICRGILDAEHVVALAKVDQCVPNGLDVTFERVRVHLTGLATIPAPADEPEALCSRMSPSPDG